jgi:hypothetical protein
MITSTFAWARLPHPGTRLCSSIGNDTSDSWSKAGWLVPVQYDGDPFGYLAPLAWMTSVGPVPGAFPPPPQVTQQAMGGSSSTAIQSAALIQVLYLQEPGDFGPISVTDIHQGQMGDCFLLSSIGELALFDPNWITNMIHANADGTETVTLYNAADGSLPTWGTTSFTPVTITVANTFPSNSVNSGFGQDGQDVVNGQQEVWVQVLEKAVATLDGGYGAIANGGYPSVAMEELTGCTANFIWSDSLSLQQLQNAAAAGDLITFDTLSSGNLAYNMVTSHAYMFQSLSTVNGTVMVNLLNPWGFDQPNPIPFFQIGSVCEGVDIGQFVDPNVTTLAPTLAQQTADQSWTQGSCVSLTLAAATFADQCGENLTYAATQANGLALPSWLTFEASTMTFSATVPSGMQKLSLSVTATDTVGLSCSETFQITVPAAAPTLAHQTAAQTWTEGAKLSFTLPSNTFADPNGEALSYTATLSNGQALPSWLTLNGVSSAFSVTVPSTSGPMAIKVTATDTSGLSCSETFQATTVPALAPTVTDQTAAQVWTEGAKLFFMLPSNTFADPNGEALSYTARLSNGQALPSWLTLNGVSGTFSGTVAYTSGPMAIKVTATDTSGLFVSETFQATLVAPPPPSVTDQTANQTWSAGKALSFALASDTFTAVAGQTLKYTATLPAGLTINPSTGAISGTVPVSLATYTIKVTATQTSGLFASETFKATVVKASAPTVVNQTPGQIWTANQPVSFTLPSNTFVDPQGEKLTYTAALSNGQALPTGLTFNATTATFGGIAPASIGATGITVTAKDQSGLSVSETFQASVFAQAPIVINHTQPQAWTANKMVSFTPPSNTFADPQGEKMTYVATMIDGSALPSWLQFNAASGAFTGTAPVTPQTLAFALTATDRSGLSVSETLQATVRASAPTTGLYLPLTWTPGAALSVSVAGIFADPQGETMTYSAMQETGAALPSGLTFNTATATFGGIAPSQFIMGIKITATNQSGLSVSTGLTILEGFARAPIVVNQTPPQAWTANRMVSFTPPSNTFADPQGEKMTYAATMIDGSTLPNWLQFNAASGAFTGTAPVTPQTLAFALTATDQSGLSVSETFHATVQASAPTVGNQTGSLTWSAGKAVFATLAGNTFVDPQGEKMTYSATKADGSALPSGLTFNTTTDAFSGTAPITPETLGLKVTATNASGLSVSETFSATIQGASPTVAHQTANQIWTDGKSMSFLLPSGTFNDPQGAALTYTAYQTSGSNQTSWLHFDPGSADFAGTVPAKLAGTIGIKVVATDIYRLSNSESFGLTFAAPGAHISAAGAPGGMELFALHG